MNSLHKFRKKLSKKKTSLGVGVTLLSITGCQGQTAMSTYTFVDSNQDTLHGGTLNHNGYLYIRKRLNVVH